MSADNGVYILRTKDQYRVIHAQAIENLYWTFDGFREQQELVPTRVVEYYGNVRYTKSRDTALKVADAIARQWPILEYGISFIETNKTWKQIVYEAKRLAVKEIESISSEAKNDRRKYAIQKLEKIISA